MPDERRRACPEELSSTPGGQKRRRMLMLRHAKELEHYELRARDGKMKSTRLKFRH